MAITSAQLQTALGTNPMNAQVLGAFEPSVSTSQQWYVIGNVDAPGRARLVTTTAADNAATQAAAVLTALRA
tara:strand:+ start:455 stop:670 length:216 start_codon:yes stop_codon:yes gene_type:complete